MQSHVVCGPRALGCLHGLLRSGGGAVGAVYGAEFAARMGEAMMNADSVRLNRFDQSNGAWGEAWHAGQRGVREGAWGEGEDVGGGRDEASAHGASSTTPWMGRWIGLA